MLCPDQKIGKKIATALVINFCPQKVPLFTPLYPTFLTLDSALVIDVFAESMFTFYLVHFVFIFSQHVGSRNGDADNLRSASASSNLDDSRPTADDNSGFLNAGV